MILDCGALIDIHLMMDTRILCPYWGQQNITATEFIEKVLEAGYNGVEINIPFDLDFEKDLKSMKNKASFDFVAQQWLEPQNESVSAYIKRIEERLLHLTEFEPLFINSHTGRDYYSFDDNCRVIERVLQIEAQTGIPIVHETHRGRFSFSASATAAYIKRFPHLKINSDLSHWVLVSESDLSDQESILSEILPHIHYAHARVGSTQSSQLNVPFAPENRAMLSIFKDWWLRLKRNAQTRGDDKFYICPEFGPYPYMDVQPFSNKPLADQWQLNVDMMHYLREILDK